MIVLKLIFLIYCYVQNIEAQIAPVKQTETTSILKQFPVNDVTILDTQVIGEEGSKIVTHSANDDTSQSGVDDVDGLTFIDSDGYTEDKASKEDNSSLITSRMGEPSSLDILFRLLKAGNKVKGGIDAEVEGAKKIFEGFQEGGTGVISLLTLTQGK